MLMIYIYKITFNVSNCLFLKTNNDIYFYENVKLRTSLVSEVKLMSQHTHNTLKNDYLKFCDPFVNVNVWNSEMKMQL